MTFSKNTVQAIVLAGGYGTRIKHLLPDIPKPMAPVMGRPFLEWVVQYLQGQDISQAILSTGHLGSVIETHFQHNPVAGIIVSCCHETSALGTAGGFLNAVRSRGNSPADVWLVLNGDTLVLTPLSPLIAYLNDPTIDGVIVGLSVEDTSRYGSLEVNPAGNLVRFREKCPGSGIINAGVFLLRHTLLDKFPKGSPLGFENQVFPDLLAQGATLKVHGVEAPFLDIGTPESLPLARPFMADNLSYFRI